MKILITGATGLVGTRLGQLLCSRGHQLVALSRNAAKARLTLPYPADVYAWQSGSVPPAALQGVEAVIHLAGESVAARRWTRAQKRKIHDSRVDSTRALHESLRQNSVRLKAFVSASAVGFYGDRGDELLDETSPPGADFLAEVCRDWEQAVFATQDCSDRQVVLRTGVVLSNLGGALPQLLRPLQMGAGGKLGSGRQWVSWIHLEDLCELYAWALEGSVQGPVNAVAPQPVTNAQLTNTLAQWLRKPALLKVPALALKMALGEMSGMLLASTRVVSPPEFHFRYPELKGALEPLLEAARQGSRELVAEQWVPRAPAEVFSFFSDEANLEELTPPSLNFSVLGKSTPQLQKGTLIDYRLKLYGMPFRWQTLIETWEPNQRFVDVQLKGPYARWHHTHEFEPLCGGTLIRDRVLYRLPLGVLGQGVGGYKVERELQRIFAFRRSQIGDRFS